MYSTQDGGELLPRTGRTAPPLTMWGLLIFKLEDGHHENLLRLPGEEKWGWVGKCQPWFYFNKISYIVTKDVF